MDHVCELQRDLASPTARKRRQERRSARLVRFSTVGEAIADVGEGFVNRNANLWMKEEGGATKKVMGHAGAAACGYVSEAFGEFDIGGTLKTTYTGMEREAGHGGHGITQGTVNVEVELQPIKGVLQRLDVPVTVRNGYMLSPGLFYHQGTPYILSQSAIDELMRSASFKDEVKTDRLNMYSPPKSSGRSPYQGAHDRSRSAEARTAELVVEITIPDTRQVIPCGARVAILAEYVDGIHVRSDAGVEALVSSTYLR